MIIQLKSVTVGFCFLKIFTNNSDKTANTTEVKINKPLYQPKNITAPIPAGTNAMIVSNIIVFTE